MNHLKEIKLLIENEFNEHVICNTGIAGEHEPVSLYVSK